MELYVAEQPESCLNCEFCNKGNYCCYLIQKDVREYRDNCPLKSLKAHDRAVKQHAYKKGYNDMRIQYELGEYTKQVRKEVCEEIRQKAERTYTISPSTNKPQKEVLIILAEILDQIQGETK